MRPPRLRYALFPLIYPPHLLVLPATFGLHLILQTHPYFRALYAIHVCRTKGLPTASFRFHLTMDTLAVQLYTSSLPRCIQDFHSLERAHGAQTKIAQKLICAISISTFGSQKLYHTTNFLVRHICSLDTYNCLTIFFFKKHIAIPQ